MPTLIYDSECPYCTAIAGTASRLGGIETLDFQSERAGEMLEEAFDDPGFTLYLFEEDRVYWGSKASARTSEIIGIPHFLTGMIVWSYPYLVRLFTILTGRSPAEMPSCDEESCYRVGEGGWKKME